MKISYSAPGKVIFSGEHAVVYGKPALVCALNRRLKFTLDYHLENGRCQDGNIKFIKNLVAKFLNQKTKLSQYRYQINSEIPIGRGLGSSAALSTAATACFLNFFSGKSFDKKTINSLAYEAEKKFHQTPSGVDNTTSCFGGLIYYRKEFEFLKNISHLPFKIPKEIEERLFLIDSGKPNEKTAEMVGFVKENYSKKTEKIFEEIEKITKRMVLALKEKNQNEFARSIFKNERLLEKLGVVSEKTKNLLYQLKSFGVGKITGAGGKKRGSGYLLFFSQNNKKLTQFLKEKTLSYLKFKPDYQGLIVTR